MVVFHIRISVTALLLKVQVRSFLKLYCSDEISQILLLVLKSSAIILCQCKKKISDLICKNLT